MTVHIPDYLYPFSTGASAWVVLSVLALIWAGVARLPRETAQRVTTGGLLSMTLLAWYALAQILGAQNIYWAVNNPVIPTIQFGILIPIAMALWLIIRSPRMTRLIDAIPLSWLVGIQFYRILGFMFLVLWSGGHLPWQFALPAGIGDTATGILALVVIAMLALRVSGAENIAYAWCLFGIADLVIAVGTGFATSPGFANILSEEAPNLLVTAYPLVMIPTFAVPLSIILHGLCIWKLGRLRRRTPQAKSMMT